MESNSGSDLVSNAADINPESLVAEVRAELAEIDAMNVNDHADRFEQLHNKLNSALSSIDGM
jgi:hypothetical protein|uniref:hypothetical protein n=1 Tax=Candidatus Planktophila sp. TaxID=2175601 RepID=UPI00404A14F6